MTSNDVILRLVEMLLDEKDKNIKLQQDNQKYIQLTSENKRTKTKM